MMPALRNVWGMLMARLGLNNERLGSPRSLAGVWIRSRMVPMSLIEWDQTERAIRSKCVTVRCNARNRHVISPANERTHSRGNRLAELLNQLRYCFESVRDKAIIGDLEDRLVRIGVDRYDRLRVLHTRKILDGS